IRTFHSCHPDMQIYSARVRPEYLPRAKTICVTIAPYYGIDKNNPRRTCTRHRPSFSYQDLRPHECDNH
ncbi:hypothetical protein, partial [Klebsiella quasipneumoniae]|uniref:hypothetical protein n=1 Tax=Klebsiella quasipneumoniae TaxID=1463165 RepID=UPI001D0D5C5D